MIYLYRIIMKPQDIINLARRQTGCTLDIVTLEEAYQFLNFVIEDFGTDIRSCDSWYWFDIVNINVTAGQPQYQFDNIDWSESNAFPIHKIQSVWLKDLKTNKWRDLPVHFVDKVDLNAFESTDNTKCCFITRSDLNLIPTPKESTEMQVWGFNYNSELTTTDNLESDIWIPKRWHYILVEGLKYRMYGNMWVNFEEARVNSRNFYDSEKMKAIQNIMDRWQLADTAYYPDLTPLIY